MSRAYPEPGLYERFQATVASVPQAIAIDLGSRQVAYAELDYLVECFAGKLFTLDLPRQSRIGLLGVHELSTYVGYLAILRLGHVVVPLGPSNPVEFQARIAELAQMRAVVVNSAARPDLAAALTGRFAVIDPELAMAHPAGAAPVRHEPDDLAYLLFTSGSTGTPKGVPIKEKNVSSYLDFVLPDFDLRPGDRISHTFALTFDPSVFDLFGAWGSGATLVIPRKRELLMPSIYVNSRELTHWYSVPSLIAYAQRVGNLKPGSMPGLRGSRFIGEPLTEQLAMAWQSAAPNSLLENTYGPTEATISCVHYRLPASAGAWRQTSNGTVPIGMGVPGIETLVVGADGAPAPEGELYLRGPQRFDGYLDPANNAGSFALDSERGLSAMQPGQELDLKHWYRTGDLVRVLDGALVHLGRIDRQVKVRGHRIELGDVEGAIRRHRPQAEAAVLAVPDQRGDVSLVAFVSGHPSIVEGLSDDLATSIPSYMVPARFVVVDELPLNPNGKLDYRVLKEQLTSA